MKLQFPKINSHKAIRFGKKVFPTNEICYIDSDPLIVGAAISDGEYKSSMGIITVKDGAVLVDNQPVNTLLIGVNEGLSKNEITSFNYYRIVELNKNRYLINFRDYEKLIEILEMVPV